jgi:hypothetical protein
MASEIFLPFLLLLTTINPHLEKRFQCADLQVYFVALRDSLISGFWKVSAVPGSSYNVDFEIIPQD